MSAIAAHIQLAEREGAQAGFDQYVARITSITKDGKAGLPQNRSALAAIRKAGAYSNRKGTFKNPEKALAFYCAKFGIGAASTVSAAVTPVLDDQDEQFKQFMAFQAFMNGGAAVEDEDDEEPMAEVIELHPPSSTKQAYAPSDAIANEPATNGRLWKMNTLGLLGDGSIITNMQAHNAIAAALS